MFKFNFNVGDNDNKEDNCNEIIKKEENKSTENLTIDKDDTPQWYSCEKLELKSNLLENIRNSITTATMLIYGNYEIGYITPKLKELPKDIAAAVSSHSDLIPAKYEGGLKIWECTHDLSTFLTSSEPESESKAIIESFCDKSVLDLGCGAGLLGILALKGGASVCFQDYNRDVLVRVTIPNILLNFEDEIDENAVLENSQYYYGDWDDFVKVTDTEKKYDFILTSETIYNKTCYKKLLNVFKNKLEPTGVVYLAAKSYYFGVGGGIREFEEMIKSDGYFKSEVVWKCSEGVQREILKISRNNKS